MKVEDMSLKELAAKLTAVSVSGQNVAPNTIRAWCEPELAAEAARLLRAFDALEPVAWRVKDKRYKGRGRNGWLTYSNEGIVNRIKADGPDAAIESLYTPSPTERRVSVADYATLRAILPAVNNMDSTTLTVR